MEMASLKELVKSTAHLLIRFSHEGGSKVPSLFRLFGYVIFFWSNEGAPLEPVHVHVAKGVPNASATKIWITEAGGCIVANNNSKIPARTLSAIVDVLESRSSYIVAQWNDVFGESKVLLLILVRIERCPPVKKLRGRRFFALRIARRG